jgi:hypothetical protein
VIHLGARPAHCASKEAVDAKGHQGERRAQATPALQPILELLDGSIRSRVPGLQYATHRKRPYYGLPDLGWIIEVAAYDVSVNVVFLGGADFACPPPLGTTDRTRYVKVASLEDARRPQLHGWIEAASRTPGWR